MIIQTRRPEGRVPGGIFLGLHNTACAIRLSKSGRATCASLAVSRPRARKYRGCCCLVNAKVASTRWPVTRLLRAGLAGPAELLRAGAFLPTAREYDSRPRWFCQPLDRRNSTISQRVRFGQGSKIGLSGLKGASDHLATDYDSATTFAYFRPTLNTASRRPPSPIRISSPMSVIRSPSR